MASNFQTQIYRPSCASPRRSSSWWSQQFQPRQCPSRKNLDEFWQLDSRGFPRKKTVKTKKTSKAPEKQLKALRSGPPTDPVASAHFSSFSSFSSFSRSSPPTWQALGWTVAGPMITCVNPNCKSHHVQPRDLDFSITKTDNSNWT